MATKQEIINNIDKRFFLGICHRGLHNEEITENGIKAFNNAINNDMAFELDVHLSKDGYLMVCHDYNLKRTTGLDGIIEKLTKDEIQKNYRLYDGGIIPTLDHVLELVSDKIPVVIEIKEYHFNGIKCGKALRKILNGKPRSQFLVISFSPLGLIGFGKSHYRSLLVGKRRPYMFMFRHMFDSIDIDYSFLNKKKIKRYHQKHLITTFTIESNQDLLNNYELADLFTFQYLDTNFVKNTLKNRRLD